MPNGNSSVESSSKRKEPYGEICTTKLTVVVDADRLHNVVAVNRFLLACTANEDALRCNITEGVTEGDNKREATSAVANERWYT